ncbi:MAG: DJ-1/PfpI family protein [Kiritimatiellae bacterium]|nr:DJ-1/PfpI family protein [Kiritimatiellia bacterium]
MRVLVPLADGLEEIEAVTIIDVLRRGGLDVVSAALGRDRSVCGSRGVTILADALWPDTAEFDAFVLPGGGKGTENLAADERVLETLRNFDEEGKYVAAICAAPTVLAAAGLLQSRRATCYPACAAELGEAYDNVPVVADGNIITGQGPGSAMLFALVLITHFVDEETARSVAEGLLFSFN